MKKKTPLLSTIVINSFEKKISTFRRRGGKNPLLSTTLCQFAHYLKIKIIIYIYFKTNNDHGVDVSIMMVI
jgi:hypothetical protein